MAPFARYEMGNFTEEPHESQTSANYLHAQPFETMSLAGGFSFGLTACHSSSPLLAALQLIISVFFLLVHFVQRSLCCTPAKPPDAYGGPCICTAQSACLPCPPLFDLDLRTPASSHQRGTGWPPDLALQRRLNLTRSAFPPASFVRMLVAALFWVIADVHFKPLESLRSLLARLQLQRSATDTIHVAAHMLGLFEQECFVITTRAFPHTWFALHEWTANTLAAWCRAMLSAFKAQQACVGESHSARNPNSPHLNIRLSLHGHSFALTSWGPHNAHLHLVSHACLHTTRSSQHHTGSLTVALGARYLAVIDEVQSLLEQWNLCKATACTLQVPSQLLKLPSKSSRHLFAMWLARMFLVSSVLLHLNVSSHRSAVRCAPEAFSFLMCLPLPGFQALASRVTKSCFSRSRSLLLTCLQTATPLIAGFSTLGSTSPQIPLWLDIQSSHHNHSVDVMVCSQQPGGILCRGLTQLLWLLPGSASDAALSPVSSQLTVGRDCQLQSGRALFSTDDLISVQLPCFPHQMPQPVRVIAVALPLRSPAEHVRRLDFAMSASEPLMLWGRGQDGNRQCLAVGSKLEDPHHTVARQEVALSGVCLKLKAELEASRSREAAALMLAAEWEGKAADLATQLASLQQTNRISTQVAARLSAHMSSPCLCPDGSISLASTHFSQRDGPKTWTSCQSEKARTVASQALARLVGRHQREKDLWGLERAFKAWSLATTTAKARCHQERLHRLEAARAAQLKDLSELCLCPLSFELMREPVVGTDCRTYEKVAIETSLDTKPASSFTRAPMEKRSLRPNLLAVNLVELMVKHFPDWEAAMDIQRLSPAPPVSQELLDAINLRNSDQAVEMLGRDVDFEMLNGGFELQSTGVNLLQLSICLNLPQVAIAIIRRPDFRRIESYSEKGLLAIHMAASFNMVDVCLAIAEDMGGYALDARTLGKVELQAPSGQIVSIPPESTALECARLFGHDPDWVNLLEG